METTANTIPSSRTFDNSWRRAMGSAFRFAQDSRRTLLMQTGVYYGFWLLIGLLCGINGIGTEDAGTLVFFCTAGLCAAVAASVTFNDMRTKEGRLSLLMQPASAAEKFWPRYIYAMIIAPLWILAGIIALELGNWIGLSFIDISRPHFVTIREILDNFTIQKFLFLIMMVFVNQSFFILGAILWPRHAFLKTFALQIATASIGSLSLGYILAHSGWILYYTDTTDTAAFIFVISVQVILTLLFSLFTYLRLKKSTIIYGLKQ